MTGKQIELSFEFALGLTCLVVAVCICAISMFGGMNPERVNTDAQVILRALFFPLGVISAGIGVLLLRGVK